MKINKMIAAAALAAIMTVSLAGCASSPSAQESQTTTTAEATATAAQTEGTAAGTTASQPEAPSPIYDPSEPQGLYVTVNGVNVRL